MRRRQTTTARRTRQRGQAMVESALVLIVTMGVLIGTCDFGQFLFLHQSLTERVRAAARYGAVRAYTWPGTEMLNVAVYNDPNAPNGSSSIVPGLTTSMVTAEIIGEGTDSARIRVSINNFPFNFFSPWIAQHATARTIIASVPYEHGP
ncbi:MAG TPA: TadE family protein [Bryobacteraceae bacterium]|nr:TadE family protein [Bryobacteraceae bacterium]